MVLLRFSGRLLKGSYLKTQLFMRGYSTNYRQSNTGCKPARAIWRLVHTVENLVDGDYKSSCSSPELEAMVPGRLSILVDMQGFL